MHSFSTKARGHRSHRRFLSRQHQLVEGTLLATEATVDREGAGNVAVVVIIKGATGIDQQQITVVQRGVVGDVMQHAGVVAAGHDRAVGRASGTLLQEMLLNHGLHLPLVKARPHHLASQLVGLGRDPRRLTHALQLLGALAQP